MEQVLLALRAAVPLAQVQQQAGENEDTHDLLVPIYNWFSESFDTPGLVKAESPFDEVS